MNKFDERNLNYFNKCITDEEREKIPFVGTFSNLLKLVEKQYNDLPAFRDKNKSLTYKQLLESLGQKRNILKEKGFNKGDVIGVLIDNSVIAVEWMFAIISFGAILIPFPVSFDEKRYLASVTKFGIKGMVTSNRFAYVNQLGVQIISPETISDKTEDVAQVVKEDSAMIIFTGGTTGDPKGTLLSHCSIVRAALNGVYIPNGVFNQLFLSVLPFSHVFGFVRSLLTPLYCGSEVYISSPYSLLRDVSVVKPTIGVMVPGLADTLLKTADKVGEKMLGGRLNKIICGGAAIPKHISIGFKKYKVRMLTGYGMTETANSISIGFEPLETNNSVGKIYMGQGIRFVDGEVQLKGDNLFTCYYNDKLETEKAFTSDGWFKTGDVGYLDENEYLHLTGRIKNIILLSNGENIYPEEIEEYFKNDSFVKECLVKEDTTENGTQIIAIEILPISDLLSDSMENLNEIFKKMVDEYNNKQPSYKKIAKVTVRLNDFDRTISMKIWRK